MKKRMLCLMIALLLCVLSGCAGNQTETTLPAETTQPMETEPVETTVSPATIPPETTEPVIPDAYLCLDEMIAGSDIVLTVDGSDITLTEDGLTVTMSTDSRIVKRYADYTGIMKDVPRIVDGKVYIHSDFFGNFFCKDGSDRVSLFHGALFYVAEVREALMNPDASEFNRKVAEAVCLPGSMGIHIPRLDENRIYLDVPLPQEKHTELKHYGYEGSFTYSEYNLIIQSLSLKEAGLSDTDDVTTVGKYRQENPERHELMTEEHAAFFEEKQILTEDFWYLYSWFHGGFMGASDEDLIEALETCYRTDLMFKLDWEYPEN